MDNEKFEREKMNGLARKSRKEYMRKWRLANPDKVRKNTENYWMRRAMREVEEQKRKEANNG